MNKPFDNHNVIVVDASSGIGEAAAKLYRDGGATVAVMARRLDRLQGIEGTLPFQMDITEPDEINLATQEAIQAFE